MLVKLIDGPGDESRRVELDKAVDAFDRAGETPPQAEVDWTDDSDLGELLEAADAARGIVRIHFDRLTPQLLVNVVFAHPSVQAVERPVPAAGDGPHRIGSLMPMPHDPNEYESHRGLSLVSEQMKDFVEDLRFELRSMKRTKTPSPPWDSFDRSPSELEADQIGGLVRYTLPSLEENERKKRPSIERPNLSDVFAAHTDPNVREQCLLTFGDAEAEVRKSSGWDAIPPPVLITGESGTGKTLVADLIHQVLFAGAKSSHPLVKVNIGAADVSNFDHSMFGSAPGHFTDVNYAVGYLAQAAYGTVFLDEIGDLPLAGQTRLLTFLDDRRVAPTGMVPFFGFGQIVAATNRDLDSAVRHRHFKHDLLARFGRRVNIPPLRSRGSHEIRRMVDFAAQNPQYNPLEGGRRPIETIAPEAMDLLCRHHYRNGNFRELEMCVHGALLKAWRQRRRTIEAADISIEARPAHRTDARGAKITVKQLPTADRVVEVAHQDELEVLAERLGQVVLVETGRAHLEQVVLYDDVIYSWKADAAD